MTPGRSCTALAVLQRVQHPLHSLRDMLLCPTPTPPQTRPCRARPVPQVVSCEMIEAVGHEHLQAYFRTLGAMLRPGGKCVIQVRRGVVDGGRGRQGRMLQRGLETPVL